MKRIAWIAALSALLLMAAACNKPASPQPGPGAKPAPPVSKPAPAHSVTETPAADRDTPKPGAAAPSDSTTVRKPKAAAFSSKDDSPFDEPVGEVKKPTDKPVPGAKPKGVLDAMGKALIKGIANEEKQSPR